MTAASCFSLGKQHAVAAFSYPKTCSSIFTAMSALVCRTGQETDAEAMQYSTHAKCSSLTNGAVLSIVHFGIVPGPWLPVSCTLFGLPTLAKKHAKELTNNKTVPQSWDSIQVQALSH